MASHPGRVLAVVVGLVIGLAVLTEVLVAQPTTAVDDPSSPAGVVRAYVQALVAEDHEAAAALLEEGGPCEVADVERAYPPDVDRVLLVDTVVEGDEARVVIEIVVREGPFSAFAYTERHTLELTGTDAGWRITGRPWPLFECGKGF